MNWWYCRVIIIKKMICLVPVIGFETPIHLTITLSLNMLFGCVNKFKCIIIDYGVLLLWPFDGCSTLWSDRYINELFKVFDIVVFYFIIFKFKRTMRYLGFVHNVDLKCGLPHLTSCVVNNCETLKLMHIEVVK